MRTSLLQAAGIEEADVSTRDLAIRAPAPDDPPPFFCTNINTHPIVRSPLAIHLGGNLY